MIGVAVPVLKGVLWCANKAGRVRRAITGDKADA
jgi:hypothetical protein